MSSLIRCDFCQEDLPSRTVTDPPYTSLDTVLAGVPATPTVSRHFDVCNACAPHLLPSLGAYAVAVVAARRAAEAAMAADALAMAEARAAHEAALAAAAGEGMP